MLIVLINKNMTLFARVPKQTMNFEEFVDFGFKVLLMFEY